MRRRSAAVLAAATAVCVALAPGVASALMNGSTPVMTPTFSSLQVAPATTPASNSSCGPVASFSATASLSWVASVTSALTSVQVLRRVSPAPFTTVATLTGTATSYTDTNLLTATTYTYQIRSNVGSFSADSTTTSTTTPALCL